MSGDPWLTASAAAIAGSSMAVLAFKLMRAAPPRAPRPQVPVGLRTLWRVVERAGAVLAPRLPAPYRQRVQRRLQRAGLDELVAPQDWLAMQLLIAAAIATVAIAVANPDPAGLLIVAGALAVLPEVWLHDRIRRRELRILAELPGYLDMLTLALEAGASLTVALRLCVDKAPASPLREAFERTVRELRTGRPRDAAFSALAERLQLAAIGPLIAAIQQAESTGGSLGAVLRAQAEQRTHERFARAEKLALEAPVKMLGPLILCIFPCTFIVLAFPVAVRLMSP